MSPNADSAVRRSRRAGATRLHRAATGCCPSQRPRHTPCRKKPTEPKPAGGGEEQAEVVTAGRLEDTRQPDGFILILVEVQDLRRPPPRLHVGVAELAVFHQLEPQLHVAVVVGAEVVVHSRHDRAEVAEVGQVDELLGVERRLPALADADRPDGALLLASFAVAAPGVQRVPAWPMTRASGSWRRRSCAPAAAPPPPTAPRAASARPVARSNGNGSASARSFVACDAAALKALHAGAARAMSSASGSRKRTWPSASAERSSSCSASTSASTAAAAGAEGASEVALICAGAPRADSRGAQRAVDLGSLPSLENCDRTPLNGA